MSVYTGQKKFRNRKDAGEQLGIFLKDYQEQNVLVIGIPRGGLEVGFYVAQSLEAEFTFIISKKLPYPDQSEMAFGSITEEGYTWISDSGKKRLNQEIIGRAIEEQQLEIKRRIKDYRKEEPLPNIKGRTIILVDDGIATGATLMPVIRLCRDKEAEKIIVAAPVSGRESSELISKLADTVKILEQPELFYAVGQMYDKFTNMTEEEVLEILKKAGR